MPDLKENDGLQEALKRIEEAKRTRAKELDLSRLGLTVIPEAIAQLSQLVSLDLTGNQISAIPSFIVQLSNLIMLHLGKNQMSDIPDHISQLSELQQLELDRNQISALPESIAKLSQLHRIDLSGNRIGTIPEPLLQISTLRLLILRQNKIDSIPETIAQLSQLQALYLGGNRINAIPESIGRLSFLNTLSLWSNQIATIPDYVTELSMLRMLSLNGNRLNAIPDSIGRLANLERLNLSHNRITIIPASIAKLSQLRDLELENNEINAIPDFGDELHFLKTLNLRRNKITAIPDSIARLSQLETLNLSNNRLVTISEKLVELKKLQRLFLQGNPGLGIPEEILMATTGNVGPGAGVRSPREILAYIAEAADSRPLNEAKLILVGQGAVGKTSLVKTVLTGKFNKKEKNTEGIKISDWECPLGGGNKAAVHIWDFGGQEMMHATHKFFLTQRSLYLLVLNRRPGSLDREADYWFHLIRAFGGEDAPVIVVLNKQKSEPFDVNREGWLEKYRGNIKTFVATDCENKRSITELKRTIVEELRTMESLKARFPRRWFAIKDALSQMTAEHINFEDYRNLCLRYGESDLVNQNFLTGTLHNLGIALNYGQDPRLRFNYVLKPEWVTQGIYALLHAFVRSKGVFTHAEAERELAKKNYSAQDTHFILNLMERFDLSFSLGDKQNRVLIPELLDDQQPKEAGRFDPAQCLNFGYKYPVLTEGLLPRFIARTHHLGQAETRWKSGVILEDASTGCHALVRADAADAEVRVHIDGPQEARRELLGIIRYNFDVIHSDYEFKPEAQVYPPAAPQEALSVKKLEVLARTKTTIDVVLADDTSIEQNISALIDSVAPPPAPLKLFLSYSHLEEGSINELRKDLSIMERNGLIRPWYDRALTAGEKWEPSILNELNAADIVVCQLSREYLFSKNCLAELNAAIERNQAGEATLAAYVLNDCGWKEFRGLSKLQVLPKDGKPLLDWPDHNKYWRAVIDGIQNAIKKFQIEKKSRPGRAGMEN